MASRAAVRCHRYGRLRKRNLGPLFQPPVEGKLIRGFEDLDVGDRVRVELIGTDVERGFINFVRAERGQGGVRFACPGRETDHYISISRNL
jgi:hypothetical protein